MDIKEIIDSQDTSNKIYRFYIEKGTQVFEQVVPSNKIFERKGVYDFKANYLTNVTYTINDIFLDIEFDLYSYRYLDTQFNNKHEDCYSRGYYDLPLENIDNINFHINEDDIHKRKFKEKINFFRYKKVEKDYIIHGSFLKKEPIRKRIQCTNFKIEETI